MRATGRAAGVLVPGKTVGNRLDAPGDGGGRSSLRKTSDVGRQGDAGRPSFLNAPGRPSIQFLSFATNHISNIATFEKPLSLGLAVSPDGKWILYSQVEQSGRELMLVENFR